MDEWQEWGRAGNTYHMSDVMLTRGGHKGGSTQRFMPSLSTPVSSTPVSSTVISPTQHFCLHPKMQIKDPRK